MLQFISDNMATLTGLYNSPGRYYHTLDHIQFCLARMEEAKMQPEFISITNRQWDALEIAIWFHDVIYNPEAQMVKPGYSELESIEFMFALGIDFTKSSHLTGSHELQDFSYQLLQAEKCIKATINHSKVPDDLLVALMVDIDLSSLALVWSQFQKNTNNVVKEYSLFRDRDMIAVGNAQFLQKMLSAEHLYHTNWGQEKFEEAARSNIKMRVEDILGV